MKIKLILLLLILSSSLTHSQIVKSIGFKGGISFSTQDWKYEELSYELYFNTKAGYYGVFTLDFINKEYWDLMLDFGLYQSNNTTEVNHLIYFSSESQPNFDISYGFYTINPSFKLKFPVKKLTPYIFLGPRFDYYNENFNKKGTYTYFADNIIKKSIWGFNVGEGFCYRIKRFSIIAEYKFMYSFTYIVDEPSYFKYLFDRNTLKIYTHVVSLGLKYHFTKD